jgi:hypothetical protein
VATSDDERWNRATEPAKPGAVPASTPPRVAVVSPFDPPHARFVEGPELGRGGMGRVYEARDVALDRGVAIKQALSDDLAILARFEREVRITARLQHPSIVPVLDAGRDADGHPYYVMRKIEGQPLSARVSDARTAAGRIALVPNVLAAVDALAYAHARGVIHRDVKPWNILVGAFGETLVIDWGLARELDREDDAAVPSVPSVDGLTTAGRVFGTPGFMAPEQARGEPADRSSDVYALGATLAHVLTGAPPFAGIEADVAIAMAARGEAPQLAFSDEVPAELIAIATKAMSPSRSARYADAGALAGDLRRFLTGQLVAAHVYTLRERIARWSRKHKLVLAIGTAAVVAVATISTIAIRNAVVARTTNAVAEAKAAARAEELLLERASTFARTSPTSAIAVLAELPAHSTRWDRARMVAESALANGVAWGYQIEKLGINAQLFGSPDGKTFAVASGSLLVIGEPSLRTPPRIVFRADPDVLVAEIAWLDDRTVVASMVGSRHAAAIQLIDRDGKMRALEVGTATTAHVVQGCRRPFVTLDGKLTELDPDGGPPRRDLGPVTQVTCVRGGIIYSTRTELVVERDGQPAARIAGLPEVGGDMTGDLALGRFAYVATHEVVEGSIDERGLHERGRWPAKASQLAYWGDRLVGQEESGIVFLVPGQQPLRLAAELTHTWQLATGALSPRASDLFVAGDHMIFHLGTGEDLVAIAPFSGQLYGVVVTDRYLVALTDDGTLRSWDLETLLPKLYPNTERAAVAAVSDGSAWLTINEQVVHLDLATKQTRTIASRVDEETQFVCSTPAGAILSIDQGRRRFQQRPLQLDAYDPRTNERRMLTDTAADVRCSHRWLGLQTTKAIEVRDLAHPEVRGRVFDIAGTIRGFAISDRWLAIIETGNDVTVIELESGRRTRGAFGELDNLVIDNHGRIATVHDGVVSLRSSASEPPRAVTDKLPILSVVQQEDGILVFVADHSVVVIDAAGHLARYTYGGAAAIAAGHLIAIRLDDKLALLDIRDGSTVQFPWLAQQLAISPDGTTIAITRTFSPTAIVRLHVPDDVRGWLPTATNARLAPNSSVLVWPKVK